MLLTMNDHVLLRLQVTGSFHAGPFEPEDVGTLMVGLTVELLPTGQTETIVAVPLRLDDEHARALAAAWHAVAERYCTAVGVQATLWD